MAELVHVRHMASDLVDGHAGLVRVKGGVEAWLTDIATRIADQPGTGTRVPIFGDAAGTVTISEAVSADAEGSDPGAIHYYVAAGTYDLVLRAGSQMRVIDNFLVGVPGGAAVPFGFDFEGDPLAQTPAVRPAIGRQTDAGPAGDCYDFYWFPSDA